MGLRFPVSTLQQMGLVSRGVFIELMRRRALSVVALLAGLFVAGALAARVAGIEKPAVGTFLLNLGLSLAYWCAHLLTLLLAAGQIPNEIENRTLHTLLARPVSRGTVLLGKWAACSLAGSGIYLVLGLVAWLAVPKLEAYDARMLAQTVFLAPFSIALLAALAVLFSLLWTRGVALVLLAVLLAAGSRAVAFIGHAGPGSMRAVSDWFAAYVPDFSKLDLITRYTDGIGPLPPEQMAGLAAYAAVFLAAGLALAVRLFERRPL